MFKDWSKASWNDGEQVAYDHGYTDGKIAGAEDLLAEKDEWIADLESVIDECEAANYRHLDRIRQLEQLCRDLYRTAEEYASDCDERWRWESYGGDFNYRDRMDALGLLEGDAE